MRNFLLFCLFLMGFSPSVFAQTDETMTFTSANFTQIVAKGKITPETPDHFRAFLKSQNKLGQPWQATIRLTSGGGNVSAGLELGKLIRAHQVSVVAVDFCASSCVFVMMGGLNRAVEGEAKIGVHQFSQSKAVEDPTKQQFTGIDMARVQRLTGNLQEYAQEMGVDPAVIILASKTLPVDMRYLTRDELTTYKMIFNSTPIITPKVNVIKEVQTPIIPARKPTISPSQNPTPIRNNGKYHDLNEFGALKGYAQPVPCKNNECVSVRIDSSTLIDSNTIGALYQINATVFNDKGTRWKQSNGYFFCSKLKPALINIDPKGSGRFLTISLDMRSATATDGTDDSTSAKIPFMIQYMLVCHGAGTNSHYDIPPLAAILGYAANSSTDSVRYIPNLMDVLKR